LLCGVSMPAHALQYLVDRCTPNDVNYGDNTWLLAFDQTSGGDAEFVPNSGAFHGAAGIRMGSYYVANGVVNATVGKDQMQLYLQADGSLLWSVGMSQGHMRCVAISSFKPDWWFDRSSPTNNPPAVAAASPPPPIYNPHVHPFGSPPTVYEPQVNPPAPVVTNHVPITITDRSARVLVSVGLTAITMLIDTGATSMALTQSVADRLVSSGQATEGPPTVVTYADGRKIDGRSVNVATVTIGGHVLHNVHAGVENDGAEPLLGFDVLSHITGKFAINTTTSTLDLD
jgi:clan AA aspartic protease (TIGR02281 family)